MSLPARRVRFDAPGNRGLPRIAAEVDVDVAAPRLVPQEAGEIAAVLSDRDAVAVPLPADLGVDVGSAQDLLTEPATSAGEDDLVRLPPPK